MICRCAEARFSNFFKNAAEVPIIDGGAYEKAVSE